MTLDPIFGAGDYEPGAGEFSMMPNGSIPVPPEPPQYDRRLKLSEAERKRIAAQVCEAFDREEAARSAREQKWLAWNRLYEGVTSPKSKPWPKCSNLHIPMTQWHTDGVATRLNRVMFKAEPIVMVGAKVNAGENPDPATVSAEKAQLEAWLEERWREDLKIDVVGPLINTDSVKLGNCFTVLRWVEEKRAKTVTRDGEARIEEVVDYAGPRLEIIDLHDLLPIPVTAISLDAATGIAHRMKMTSAEIKRKQKDGIYDKVEVPEAKGLSEATDQDQAEGLEPTAPGELESAVHTVLECIWFYDDGKFPRDVVFSVEYENKILLQAEEHPFYHGERWIHNFRPMPRANRIYGRSVPGILEHLNAELNTLHNQIVDAGSVTNVPILLVERASPLAQIPNQVVFQPGLPLLVDSRDEVEQLHLTPQVGTWFSLESQVLAYGERATGISDFAAGHSPGGRERTLGEVQNVLSEGNLRFDDMIGAEQDPIVAISEQTLALYEQFAPEKVPPRTGWEPTFTPQGTSVEHTRPMLQQQMEMVYDRLLGGKTGPPNPIVTQDPTKVYAVTSEFLRRLGIRDIERFIGTLEEAEQMKQQMGQMQALMSALGGAGGGPGGPGGPGAGSTPPGVTMPALGGIGG